MPLAVAVIGQFGCGYDPPIVVTRVAPVPPEILRPRFVPDRLPPPPRRSPIAANSDPSPIIKANNALAFELYAQLRRHPGNLLIAPAPLTVGLSLLRFGARAETAADLDRVLHRQGDRDLAGWQRSLAALAVTLNRDSPASSVYEMPPRPHRYRIRLADSLWIQSGYSIRDEFQALLEDQFGIKDARVDLRGDPAGACEKINQWTAVQTGRRIKQVISPESLPSSTKLVLSICLYLRASWRSPFQEESTQDEVFRVGRTEGVRVPMMHEHSYDKDFDYWEDATSQILEISTNGGEYGLLIWLPRDWDGLDRLERSLQPELLETCLKAKRAPAEIDVQLPRFRFDSRFSLKETLAGLGMRQAFDGRRADFSGINGKSNDLFLSDVVHAATIDVNEKGLEAAAAVELISSDSFGDEPVSFHADHPFVFVVRDNRTGCILFLGRLANPSPSAGADGDGS
jgi:serpin B